MSVIAIRSMLYLGILYYNPQASSFEKAFWKNKWRMNNLHSSCINLFSFKIREVLCILMHWTLIYLILTPRSFTLRTLFPFNLSKMERFYDTSYFRINFSGCFWNSFTGNHEDNKSRNTKRFQQVIQEILTPFNAKKVKTWCWSKKANDMENNEAFSICGPSFPSTYPLGGPHIIYYE